MDPDSAVNGIQTALFKTAAERCRGE